MTKKELQEIKDDLVEILLELKPDFSTDKDPIFPPNYKEDMLELIEELKKLEEKLEVYCWFMLETVLILIIIGNLLVPFMITALIFYMIFSTFFERKTKVPPLDCRCKNYEKD